MVDSGPDSYRGPQPQCDALPNKLKPTIDIGVGFEPTSSESDSDVLPLHHPTVICTGVEPVLQE